MARLFYDRKNYGDCLIIKYVELDFNNGSSILFRSGEQMDSLRGFSVSGLLVLDEAAYLKDEVFEIIKPTTDV